MRSSCLCTRKASWGEQGTRSVHTTLLRADLPGSTGIGDHAIWESFMKGKKALAHHRPLAVTTRLCYRTSLGTMDCKYVLYSNMEVLT